MTVLVINLSERMAPLVAQATDILNLPTNQDFALKAMGLLLRSMGLAPANGRPVGYRQSAHTRRKMERRLLERRRRTRRTS